MGKQMKDQKIMGHINLDHIIFNSKKKGLYYRHVWMMLSQTIGASSSIFLTVKRAKAFAFQTGDIFTLLGAEQSCVFASLPIQIFDFKVLWTWNFLRFKNLLSSHITKTPLHYRQRPLWGPEVQRIKKPKRYIRIKKYISKRLKNIKGI